MIIGTAGHIDHGKTSLIKRLTGRDTDRLPEEIKRGISIELGYAYVPVGDDVLGFVDVPGHERFVHTMLAGATGIDFALLVIAADDGVMPQTDEHLDILLLLGIDAGAVALTKIDAVSAERVDEVLLQLSDRVRNTAAANWPVFPVSSLSGDGIGELQGASARRGSEPRGENDRRALSHGDRPLLYVSRRRHRRNRHRARRRDSRRRVGQRGADRPRRADRARAHDPCTGSSEHGRCRRTTLRAESRRHRKGAGRARHVGAGAIA